MLVLLLTLFVHVEVHVADWSAANLYNQTELMDFLAWRLSSEE